VLGHSVPVGEIRRLGAHALLLGVEGPVAARWLARLISAAGLRGLTEVVGGVATVMVAFDPAADGDEAADVVDRRSELAELMEAAQQQPDDEVGGGSLLEIPCSFEGPDLLEVAQSLGRSTASVIDLLTAVTLTVDVVGFSPGFAYLGGLPQELRHVSRRSQPRPAVPAGSVALANGYAAVYPTASPGGWQLIGRTDVPLFTPLVPPYARLAPGDRVRFVREDGVDRGVGVATDSPVAYSPMADPSVSDSAAGPVFVVEEAGLRTVLQDGGRRGMAALGVPTAGPADPYSFQLANALVGNGAGAAALEITARGPTLRCRRSTFVAVVGASPDVRIDGQPVEAGRVVPVNAGQQIVVGRLRGGLRAYLAVAGGFVGPAVLGSCSSDQLSGLGPGALGRGSDLWAGAMQPPLGDHLEAGTTTGAAGGEPTVLRVVPGPHPESFPAGSMAQLGSMRFTIGGESNRVGLRLHRDPLSPPLQRAPGPPVELDSQGMVTGAVQVPPDGEPVILLPDHATLGGYPVVAVVAAADLGRLGQCAPGDAVVLVPIDHEQAADAWRDHRRRMARAVVGHYPLAVE
jgi:KipI family sensor histidine kinase inhibitor